MGGSFKGVKVNQRLIFRVDGKMKKNK